MEFNCYKLELITLPMHNKPVDAKYTVINLGDKYYVVDVDDHDLLLELFRKSPKQTHERSRIVIIQLQKENDALRRKVDSLIASLQELSDKEQSIRFKWELVSGVTITLGILCALQGYLLCTLM